MLRTGGLEERDGGLLGLERCRVKSREGWRSSSVINY
jgi:hypothetical protein